MSMDTMATDEDYENLSPLRNTPIVNEAFVTSSPSSTRVALANYVGDRFIPYRNTDSWDIQFNINDVIWQFLIRLSLVQNIRLMLG